MERAHVAEAQVIAEELRPFCEAGELYRLRAEDEQRQRAGILVGRDTRQTRGIRGCERE